MKELQWLYSTRMFGMKLGLGNSRALLELLAWPPADSPLVFHVAGTNGKGSTCAFIESILRHHGLRTGLFTSPHLVRFHERIQIDRQPISDSDLEEHLRFVRESVPGQDPHPTFFEIALAVAMRHFMANKVEALVVETGMGGRLDATNAITPVSVSAITPVDLDHKKWLGESLESVAGEKAGIIKSSTPVVTAPQKPAALSVLQAAATTRGAPFTTVSKTWENRVGIPGLHQNGNAAVAAEVVRQGVPDVSADTLEKGIASTRWPGRFQEVEYLGRQIILDGAHNPHAITALVATWLDRFSSRRAPILFGCAEDKDYAVVLGMLAKIARHFTFVPIPGTRSADPTVLAAAAPQRIPHEICHDLKSALAKCPQDNTTLLTGSLFLVGQALELGCE